MNGEKKQQHKNSTRDEIAPESYHVHIEKKIMIHRKCSIKVQLLSHNGMENTGVICMLICHLSQQVYIVQNLNEKYVYLIFQPVVPIKLSQNQGALHFCNLTDVSKLLSLCLRVG